MHRDRWFGTPVGAALLVGALAGGMNMFALCLLPAIRELEFGVWQAYLFQGVQVFLHYALHSSAPGVCLRDGRKLLKALGMGLLCAALVLAQQALIYMLITSFAFYSHCLLWILSLSVNLGLSGFLGYATARLYELPAIRWKCALVSLLCGAVDMAIWWLSLTLAATPYDPVSGDTAEMSFSLATITSLIQVVPLGFVIERKWTSKKNTQITG